MAMCGYKFDPACKLLPPLCKVKVSKNLNFLTESEINMWSQRVNNLHPEILVKADKQFFSAQLRLHNGPWHCELATNARSGPR